MATHSSTRTGTRRRGLTWSNASLPKKGTIGSSSYGMRLMSMHTSTLRTYGDTYEPMTLVEIIDDTACTERRLLIDSDHHVRRLDDRIGLGSRRHLFHNGRKNIARAQFHDFPPRQVIVRSPAIVCLERAQALVQRRETVSLEHRVAHQALDIVHELDRITVGHGSQRNGVDNGHVGVVRKHVHHPYPDVDPGIRRVHDAERRL